MNDAIAWPRPKAILFDLDGVFYVGDKAIPGGVETLRWVEESRIPHCFLTNTTSRPRHLLVDKIAGFGIKIDAEKILTPAVAAVQWITRNVSGKTALFVPPATMVDFSRLRLAQPNETDEIAAVVIGDLGQAWDYPTLNRAFRLLMLQSRPKLIALGMTRYWHAPDGLRLDLAPFVAALQMASGSMPVVLGKPSADFFAQALTMVDCKPRQSVMIGDDIHTDIDAAQKAGIRGILVKTGKFRESDLEHGISPAEIIDSVAQLPDWWKAHQTDETLA